MMSVISGHVCTECNDLEVYGAPIVNLLSVAILSFFE